MGLHTFADKGGQVVPALWLDENFQEVNMRGSVGTDHSANKPTLPVVGSNFGGTGPYANYLLVATVPVNLNRASVEVQNLTGAQIVVILDDGTAASGQQPVQASVFALAPGVTAGQQGSSWESYSFYGRAQIYALALTGSAYVYVHEN